VLVSKIKQFAASAHTGLYTARTGRTGPHRPVDEPCTGHISPTGLNIQHAPAASCMHYCCPFSPL